MPCIPRLHRKYSAFRVLDGHKRMFKGPKKAVLADLLEFISVHDLTLFLFPYAATWAPLIVKKARRYVFRLSFSRTGWFKSMASKPYWSNGKVNHKDGVLIPESRVRLTRPIASFTLRAS
jgi:DNA polymerase, archaea type